MSSERVKPDSSTFTVAIKACINTLDLKSGEEVWEYAKEFGYRDDIFVGSSVLNMYTKCGFVKCGRIVEAIDLYRWMQREGYEDMYAKDGKLVIASTTFRIMSYRNVVSWSSLISGYAKNGYAGKALELLTHMKSCSSEPNLVALVSTLLVCSQVKFSILGREIHEYIIRRLELD
ncbi:hypothetical protein ACS0TY_006575 [Phlomoides rotata]